MLGWIERVIPQPPVLVIVEKDVEKLAARQLAEGSPGCGAEGSNVESTSGSHDPGSTTESAGQGVLTWISQGLEKVMPQPAQSPPPMLQMAERSFEASMDVPDVTEIQSIVEEEEQDAEEPELEITALQDDDEEDSVVQSNSDNNAPEKSGGKKVFTWLVEGFEKMIPQPENFKKHQEGTSEDQVVEQAHSQPLDRDTPQKGNFPASPSSTSLFPQTLGGDGSGVFKWLVQGLEKVMPQPVMHAKQDGQSVEVAHMSPGQERSKGS